MSPPSASLIQRINAAKGGGQDDDKENEHVEIETGVQPMDPEMPQYEKDRLRNIALNEELMRRLFGTSKPGRAFGQRR